MADWCAPKELPDLRRVGVIAIDSETRDDRLAADMGSGWPFRAGYICGVSVAYRAEDGVHGLYFPLRHPNSENFDPELVYQWLRDHVAAGVRFVTQNGLYDWGWLRAEAGIRMPPGERLEEIGALATMVDENRFHYSLEALCQWRGLPGKDEALLLEGIAALELVTSKRKKVVPQNHIWQLPARYVGPYAETDAVNTLALFESLNPILDQEGTRAAYRLECDLLPMALEMRLRGIRIDVAAAEQARDLLLAKRDAVFAELAKKLGCAVGMYEIGRTKWLAETFDAQKIKYPRTEKGNPSFTGGQLGWMGKHKHWLPQLITRADRYNKAATDFLQGHILDHVVNGRIHGEIHPHRSEDNGTKSFRFGYSNPPLQQMPSRDPEITPLVRGMFLPEEGEIRAKPDASQQEFRLVVHYANQHKLPKAAAAVARYRDDPTTDFHALAAEITALERNAAKSVNFAKIYGAGVKKFAEMIDQPLCEARQIYERYDRQLPFLRLLSNIYTKRAHNPGHIVLYDGARRHFDQWAPSGKWEKGAGPCALEEAQERLRDPEHLWYRRGRLYRADTHTALNALIQGSAARHTKLWMRACWREGIVPLLQMHDCLDCSVSSLEQAEMVARLGEEVIRLDVPMRVDLKFGRTWGDAKHTWRELHGGETAPAAPAEEITCAFCRTPIPTDAERASTHLDGWLLTHCVDAFLRQRMAEEGIPWDGPQGAEEPAAAGNGAAIPPPPTSPPQSRSRQHKGPYPQDPHGNSGPKRGSYVRNWIYRDLSRKNYLRVDKHVAATGKHHFYQHHWDGKQWVLEVKGTYAEKKIPYQLPELSAALQANPELELHITEGEKDADTLARLGYVVTTNPGGAGNWTEDLTAWLRVLGVRRAVIHEDNDEAGRERTSKLTAELDFIKLRVVRYPDVPPGEDVTWWLENGHPAEELEARIAAAPAAAGERYDLVCAADIVPRPMDWLWRGHILRGSQELLTGVPGGGKSQVHCAFVGFVTTGGEWPDGCNGLTPGNVIMLTAEDCLDQTIVPRLIAAGACLERVHILRKIRKDNKERMFLLSEDLAELEHMIAKVGDIRLITIDPITAYMGQKLDSHRATDVRGQLGPLADLAERTDIALSCITHPPKHSSQRAIDHFIGSQAFIAAARIGHMAIEETDEDEYGNRTLTGRSLFTNPKNNVSRRMATLAYRVEERQLSDGISAPYVIWEEVVDISADEAVAAAAAKPRNQPATVMMFLDDILASAPVFKTKIEERGEVHGFSKQQLDRAKKKMGLVAFKQTGTEHGAWMWALPQHAPSGVDEDDS